jgi:hypothetical protein
LPSSRTARNLAERAMNWIIAKAGPDESSFDAEINHAFSGSNEPLLFNQMRFQGVTCSNTRPGKIFEFESRKFIVTAVFYMDGKFMVSAAELSSG